MSLLTRVRNLWRGSELDRELDEELRFHFDMRVARNERTGMSRAEAEAEARRHIGSSVRAREGMHEARVVPWLESLVHDAVAAFRSLRRQRTLTAVAVITIALGIGVNTAIFSVLQAIWFDAVPFEDPGRLAVVQQYTGDWLEFTQLRAESRTVTGMVPFQRRVEMVVDGDGAKIFATTGITEDLFTVLGVKPILGRPFSDDDMQPGAPPVVLLAHGTWRSRYGGSADAIGKTVRFRSMGGSPQVEDRLATIVGVMPPDAKLLKYEPRFWRPIPPEGRDASRAIDEIIVRVRRGVTIADAGEELLGLMGRINPGLVPRQIPPSVVPLRDQVVGPGIGHSLFLLFAATAIVLLIACVNVANLFLARGVERKREIAVRAAIGAGRWRLVRQALMEHALVACAGCLLGVALAASARNALVASMPYSLPRTDAIAIDWRVLLFSAAIAAVTVVLTGLLPSLRTISSRPGAALSSGGFQSGTRATRRVGYGLMATEVALSVVVLTVAVLLVGSFLKLTSIDLGFDPANVASFRADPAAADRELSASAANVLLHELRRSPEVVSAAVTTTVPFGIGHMGRTVWPGDSPELQVAFRGVSPEYFDVMGIRLRAGRDFMPSDTAGGAPVIIVNERAARRLWPGRNPIGQRLGLYAQKPSTRSTRPEATVVGVVADVRYLAFDSEPEPEVYVPDAQYEALGLGIIRNFVVRTKTNPEAAVQRLEARIREITGNGVTLLTASDTYVERSVHVPRFRAMLFGIMGLLVVVLTAVGVFSVTAHVVAQRRREMGIRMAMGAERRDIVRHTLVQSAAPVAVGAAIGFCGALAAARLVTQFLFATAPNDPAMLTGTVFAVVALALIAALIPALRTRRINPVDVLRLD